MREALLGKVSTILQGPTMDAVADALQISHCHTLLPSTPSEDHPSGDNGVIFRTIEKGGGHVIW